MSAQMVKKIQSRWREFIVFTNAITANLCENVKDIVRIRLKQLMERQSKFNGFMLKLMTVLVVLLGYLARQQFEQILTRIDRVEMKVDDVSGQVAVMADRLGLQPDDGTVRAVEHRGQPRESLQR